MANVAMFTVGTRPARYLSLSRRLLHTSNSYTNDSNIKFAHTCVCVHVKHTKVDKHNFLRVEWSHIKINTHITYTTSNFHTNLMQRY